MNEVNEMNEWINLLITKWNEVINTYSCIKIIEVIKKFNNYLIKKYFLYILLKILMVFIYYHLSSPLSSTFLKNF